MMLTGCSGSANYPTDDFFHFKTDAQYSYTLQGSERLFAESEDGYYFYLLIKGNHYLFYTDKKTMKTPPVCNKPNCLHYEETEYSKRAMCNAFFNPGSYFTSVFYNNGKIYLPITQENNTIITQVSLDGSGRKELFNLEGKVWGWNMVFHRGYIYCGITFYDEDMRTAIKLLRCPLDNPQETPTVLFEQELDPEAEPNPSNSIRELRAFGNHLYFTITEDKNIFYSIDLSQKEPVLEAFMDSTHGNDYLNYTITPSDGIVFAAINDITGLESLSGEELIKNIKNKIYKTDLHGNYIETFMEIPNSSFTADDKYFYNWSFWPRDESSDYHIKIYDLEGKLLINYDFSAIAPDFSDLYVSPGELVFMPTPKLNKIYYFSKSEIETGEIHPKLLIDCSQYQ